VSEELQANLVPLAERMRPGRVSDVIGQEHILTKGKFVREIIEANQPTSLILWGPPGTGKTTLARIMGDAWKADFIEISAVTSGSSRCSVRS
jgi:putative ATPase